SPGAAHRGLARRALPEGPRLHGADDSRGATHRAGRAGSPDAAGGARAIQPARHALSHRHREARRVGKIWGRAGVYRPLTLTLSPSRGEGTRASLSLGEAEGQVEGGARNPPLTHTGRPAGAPVARRLVGVSRTQDGGVLTRPPADHEGYTET